MKRYIPIAIVLAFLLAQVPGCHYYMDAIPHIVLSSEPLETRTSVQNHAAQPETYIPPPKLPLKPEAPPS